MKIKEQDKKFLLDVMFIAPFCVLLFTTLLSSTNCGGYNTSYFCTGYPQFLQHNATYDILFMRAAPLVRGAEHWSSALVLGILPIVLYAITRDSRFAFWSAILFALWHEGYWLITGFTFHYFYNTLNFYNNFFGSVYYLVIIIAVSTFVIRRYKSIYFSKPFLLATIAYQILLLCWGFYNGLQVTVAGGLGQPILTPYYWDYATNGFEVGSWIFLAVEIAIVVFIQNRVKRIQIDKIV